MCKDKLIDVGRVYVGWTSYKCVLYEHIPRCYTCYSYNHIAKDCAKQRICLRCGKSGHIARECRASEDCINCRERGKQSSGHTALSVDCPEYVWRLKMLRMRISNG